VSRLDRGLGARAGGDPAAPRQSGVAAGGPRTGVQAEAAVAARDVRSTEADGNLNEHSCVFEKLERGSDQWARRFREFVDGPANDSTVIRLKATPAPSDLSRMSRLSPARTVPPDCLEGPKALDTRHYASRHWRSPLSLPAPTMPGSGCALGAASMRDKRSDAPTRSGENVNHRVDVGGVPLL
jgi:hypothetical protein